MHYLKKLSRIKQTLPTLFMILAISPSTVFAQIQDPYQREEADRAQSVLFYDVNAREALCAQTPFTSFARDVYFIGDSIGQGMVEIGGFREELPEDWSVNTNAEVNRTLEQGQEILSEALQVGGDAHDSRITVVELGTNTAGESAEDFQERIGDTVAQIREANPQTSIVWLDSPTTSDTEVYSNVNQAIVNAAAEFDFDTYSLFDLAYPNGINGSSTNITETSSNDLAAGDNIHLTTRGYQIAAQAFADYLEATYVATSPQSFAGGGNPNAPVTGANNAEYAYNYFIVRFGLEPYQSAGIVGNLMHESGVDPVRVENQGQPGYITFSSMAEVTPGRGYGLAQWTTAGRQDNWRNYAAQQGRDPLSMDLQLDFLWDEIQNQSPSFYRYEEFLATQTVEEATWIILAFFERPGAVIDDPQFGGRNNYRPTIAPPTSGPAFDVLQTRVSATEEIDSFEGQNFNVLAGVCGLGDANGISPPDYSARPSIQVDASPPGPHNDANCAPRFQPGAQALREYIRERWAPPVTDIGGYHCRAILFDNSRPTSIHGMGRALDIMVDGTTPEGLRTGNEIRNFLINNAEQLGIQRVIWNRHTWAANQDGWRTFSAADESPHVDHLHIEVNIEAGNNPNLI